MGTLRGVSSSFPAWRCPLASSWGTQQKGTGKAKSQAGSLIMGRRQTGKLDWGHSRGQLAERQCFYVYGKRSGRTSLWIKEELCFS